MNSHLISTPSYLSSNNHTWSCSSIQGSDWNFYAITVTATNNFIYVNGNPTPCGGGSQLGVNFNGDTTEIEFGANVGRNFYSGLIDDMRLYPYILSSVEMATIYSGTLLLYFDFHTSCLDHKSNTIFIVLFFIHNSFVYSFPDIFHLQ
jgi:hypothetical protein